MKKSTRIVLLCLAGIFLSACQKPANDTAIIEAAKAERNRLWREANQTAIDTYAEEISKEGLPLAAFRSF